MTQSKCPACGQKLRNYRYADACPHCGKPLEQNDRSKLTAAGPKTKVMACQVFPFPLLRWMVRVVES